MASDRRSLEKDVAFEQIEATSAHNSVPEVLRHLSTSELATLEKQLVRRIDLRALPILIVLFLLNILDRNAIANARLGGLEASLGIDDVQYQTAVMVLWAGYISMMVPSNMLLSIFKPKLYLPTVVIVWGIVSGATGFVQNYPGLVALRFLVGVTEAPYFPGCIFFLSCWYTRKELPSRIATFYSGYTLSSAFGGLIAAGIVDGMEGLGGYPSWRWIFIIEGALTIVLAFAGYVLLPNYPSNTSFLSAEETAMAQWRLERENDGVKDEVKESVFVGLKQALSDPKVVRDCPEQHLKNFTDLCIASAGLYSNVRCCLYELHLLLPVHRQDARLPTRPDSSAHRTTLLPRLPVLDYKLLARRTLG
tara:strand:- start:8884 stop:9972 length:1089 start_codon:yes stop_codon:yes gene_type:complete